DVMMPKLDGYEFCKKIKSNIDTSHTPVILLTANSSLDKQIKGMSYGADIYITKPFKTEFLLASAVSILENRQKLREKFQGLQKINEPEESITRHDQEFMNKLRDFVNANLTNPDLSIELLAEVMNCSKSSLIRKVKALTGITPMTFLRTYRLNTAYELLTKENLTVSEVSYKTGFSDPNYFATSFKKHFGKNPSQVG
ncbi:MAG: helix-turn-helix domain-containing protein, partial [Marinoscillum sp.]|uniref:response regulator transcription factor n=1 Tax=Marinoscillum sp. TaxID=2024838 RepID=UPI0032FC0F7E